MTSPFSPQNILALYVGAFTDELARAGVTDVCFCPGSRSAPLALTFAADVRFKLWQHLDERSAAFFALGMAKAERKPVIVLCTSGSAAANFFPAIVEARYARVPLIALTADRPHELRDVGAAQTMDQLKLYGDYAKWFVEMALPEASPEALRYARSTAARATATSLAEPAGVVHLNFPFREPLVPIAPDSHPLETDGWHGASPLRGLHENASVAPQALRSLADTLVSAERGLIICGMQNDSAMPPALAQLAGVLGYPVLADPLSGVRCGPHNRTNVIDNYDAFLRDAATVEQLEPQVVLRFGAPPTSKPVMQYLQRYPNARQILIDGGGGWRDPAHLASEVIHADAAIVCKVLADLTSQPPSLIGKGERALPSPSWRGAGGEGEWLARWRDIAARTRRAMDAQLEQFTEPFEGRVFTELAACLPEAATVFASSSMPVRDLDTFFPGDGRRIRFLSNRGLNGIDGVVSSALGAAAATTEPLVLVIGDIALYHDLNGLLAARLNGIYATIILINNDGGGIFSFLPQAAHPEHFEQLFGTPHGLDFAHAAALYGAQLHRPQNWDEFRIAVQSSLHGGGLTLIEVRTNRDSNVIMHRQVWQAVAEALK
ncbi:MAG: 2-succinyl-5-enolpyruvyl-6-hydroxy-3-cyclohexene-1-carboxylic-acid synthase [Anaerolineales bacterium]